MVAASYWGPETIIFSTNGDPARRTPVEIRDVATEVLVPLYKDSDRNESHTNPIRTDEYGNLAFYIDAGTYTAAVVGSPYSFQIVVPAIGSGGDGGGETFEWVQSTPQSVWPVITHNLGRRPAAVSLFSLDWGTQYDEFNVQHLNVNQLQISMDEPTAGRALM